MIRGGYLDPESRKDLLDIARDGSVAHALARRANALVLLDDGMSCAAVAHVLLLDDDTVRGWHQLYQRDGIDGLVLGHKGGFCRLSAALSEQLQVWVAETLPGRTRQIGAYILANFGITYESRSGLIKLLHRLGLEHRKPRPVASKLDPARQAAFISSYNNLLNHLQDDEAVLFADAVHPVHAAQPVGCWAPKGVAVAVAQTTGRDHINIHGAIDLETGATVMRLPGRRTQPRREEPLPHRPDLILDLSPLPTRGRCARDGIDQIMAAHLRKAAIVSALAPDKDNVNRGLHVVIDAARSCAFEKGERAIMRKGGHTAVGPVEPKRHQVGMQLLDGALLLARPAALHLQPGGQLVSKRVQFAGSVRNLERRLYNIGPQIFTNRVPRQARSPRNLSYR